MLIFYGHYTIDTWVYLVPFVLLGAAVSPYYRGKLKTLYHTAMQDAASEAK